MSVLSGIDGDTLLEPVEGSWPGDYSCVIPTNSCSEAHEIRSVVDGKFRRSGEMTRMR